MKMFYKLILLCTTCVLAGCARQEPTLSLDEAIDALPDEWGPYSDKLELLAKKAGTTVVNRASSTNNYAMLDRVIAVTNVHERIRLTWKLYNHFRRTPEWYVEHLDGGSEKKRRLNFLFSCAMELGTSPNSTPETIIEGWKMDAETIRDLADIIRLTEPAWPDRKEQRHEAQEFTRYEEFMRRLWKHRHTMYPNLTPGQRLKIGYAGDVRARWYNYFRYDLRLNEDYYRLPSEIRPAYVEQLKRHFFIYSDVTNAYMWKRFQPELKAAFREVQERMGAR